MWNRSVIAESDPSDEVLRNDDTDTSPGQLSQRPRGTTLMSLKQPLNVPRNKNTRIERMLQTEGWFMRFHSLGVGSIQKSVSKAQLVLFSFCGSAQHRTRARQIDMFLSFSAGLKAKKNSGYNVLSLQLWSSVPSLHAEKTCRDRG